MPDKLPEIYWYLFWIGFVVLAFRMAYLGGKAGFDIKIKALDILKMYAEKGTEPPPAVMEHLAAEILEKKAASKPDARATHLQGFIGFLFMACVSWGLYAWFDGRGGPAWAAIAAMACMAFFGLGAFGFLLATLITRQK